MTRLTLTLCLLCALAACTNTQRLINNWPSTLPPVSEFTRVYDADTDNQSIQSKTEYLVWIKRFYEGWLIYRNGWNRITERVIANVDDPVLMKTLGPRMERVGIMISSEWAKDSSQRAIRGPQLAIWGDALKEAESRRTLPDTLSAIEMDIHALLDGGLSYKEILYERYFPSSDGDLDEFSQDFE